MPDPTSQLPTTTGDARLAGAALLAAAAASVALMAHHPTNANPTLLPPIHGALLVVLCIHTLGFVYLSAVRGLLRLPVLAGMLAYAVSVFANMGAGLLNGFVTPRLIADGPEAATADILAFAWATDQSLAVMAVFAAGAASFLWGLDFMRDAQVRSKLIGGAGILLGVLPSTLLLTGVLEMDVFGAFISYSLQSAWAVLVGWLLVTGRARRTSPAPS